MTKPPPEFHQESSVLTVIQSKAGSEQPARPSATGEADLGVSLEVTLQEVNFWAYPEGQRSEVRCACLSSWMTQPSLTTRTRSDLGCSGWSQAGLVSAWVVVSNHLSGLGAGVGSGAPWCPRPLWGSTWELEDDATV